MKLVPELGVFTLKSVFAHYLYTAYPDYMLFSLFQLQLLLTIGCNKGYSMKLMSELP